jgi:ATP-dependent Clp protease ATP-binding subunit ClpC
MTGTERMTDRARQVLAIAEQEARRRGAAAVEPAHVLLALALEGAGVAAVVLRNLGVSAEQLAKQMPAGVHVPTDSLAALPWASISEQVVAQAHAELIPLRHHSLGTEHLLLAVVQVESGDVPALLSRLGLTSESVSELEPVTQDIVNFAP